MDSFLCTRSSFWCQRHRSIISISLIMVNYSTIFWNKRKITMDSGMNAGQYKDTLWGAAFDAHFPADHGANRAAVRFSLEKPLWTYRNNPQLGNSWKGLCADNRFFIYISQNGLWVLKLRALIAPEKAVCLHWLNNGIIY